MEFEIVARTLSDAIDIYISGGKFIEHIVRSILPWVLKNGNEQTIKFLDNISTIWKDYETYTNMIIENSEVLENCAEEILDRIFICAYFGMIAAKKKIGDKLFRYISHLYYTHCKNEMTQLAKNYPEQFAKNNFSSM